MPLSEFALIQRYFSALGAGDHIDLSVGDDCAVLRLAGGERLATSVDTLVSGVHFPADSFPEDIGYRAVATAASDLAAMGARPLGMTCALTLPDAEELWLHAFSQGLAQAAAELELPLVGGDTTRGPLTVTVQVLGSLPAGAALVRGGAQVGDRLYVSGTLGDAAAGLAILNGEWCPEPEYGEYLVRRFHRPSARIRLGQRLLGSATAAIDVSDGLLADVAHLASASGVRVCVDHLALPVSEALQLACSDAQQRLRWALTGGDDYELCFTFPSDQAPAQGTLIGRVEAGEGIYCDADLQGAEGYQHF